MSGDHPHIQDFEGHVAAVESDLEYFRRKRVEPRVMLFLRRGIVGWTDLLSAHDELGPPPPLEPTDDLERRIRRLEDALDQMVRDIATATVPLASHRIVIDDNRRERGDYDPPFRLAGRSYPGDMTSRIGQLEEAVAETTHLVACFTAALVARGEVTPVMLDQNRRRLEALGHHNGARIVARAWVDPEFKQRLISTGRDAVRELDIPPGRLGKLGVAENTDDVHHVVVCTLCSCYPHDLLGDPPWWYRTDEYKQRIVGDPRAMLHEMFGLEIGDDRTVTVHDSTSDVRWMVLPRRPEGTDGLTEDQLAGLVTIGSMVGSEEPVAPRRIS